MLLRQVLFSEIQGRISGSFSLQEPNSTLSSFSLSFIHLQKEMMEEDDTDGRRASTELTPAVGSVRPAVDQRMH